MDIRRINSAPEELLEAYKVMLVSQEIELRTARLVLEVAGFLGNS